MCLSIFSEISCIMATTLYPIKLIFADYLSHFKKSSPFSFGFASIELDHLANAFNRVGLLCLQIRSRILVGDLGTQLLF